MLRTLLLSALLRGLVQAEQSAADDSCASADASFDDDVALLQKRKAVSTTAAVSSDALREKQQISDVSCTTAVYSAELALPSNAKSAGMEPLMVVGTTENMDSRIAAMGLDLTGIWWMKDNPAASELMSFAGSKVNSSTFPMLLELPNAAAGRWAFQDITSAKPLVANLKTSSDPLKGGMPFYFKNSTFAAIGTSFSKVPFLGVDSYEFEYVSDDHWLRPNDYAAYSIAHGLAGTTSPSYDLLRVVRADGSPHPQYWPEFLEYMAREGKPLYGLITNDTCLRRCSLVFSCAVCTRGCAWLPSRQ